MLLVCQARCEAQESIGSTKNEEDLRSFLFSSLFFVLITFSSIDQSVLCHAFPDFFYDLVGIPVLVRQGAAGAVQQVLLRLQ
jgi:hypothetical protein